MQAIFAYCDQYGAKGPDAQQNVACSVLLGKPDVYQAAKALPLCPGLEPDAGGGSSKLGRSLALYLGVPLLSIWGASMLWDVPMTAKSSTKGGAKLLGAAILGVGAAYLIDRGLA
jgi:hypothetical protein